MLARFLLPILLCVNIYATDTKNQDSQNYEVLKAKIESVEKQEVLRHFDYKQNLDAYKDLMKAQQEQNENILNHLYWIVGSVSGIIIFILTGFGFFIKSNVPRWIGQKIDEKISNDANNSIKELETKTKTAKEAIEVINSELEDLKGLFSGLSEDDTKNLKPELKNLLTKLVEISRDKINKTAQDYYLEGLNARENNDLETAIEKFEKALSIEPTNKDALFSLAYLLGDKESTITQGINKYKEYLKIDSTNYAAWNNLGYCYDKQKMYEDAIHCFKEAIKLDENNNIASMNLGDTYQDIDEFEKAYECYKTGLRDGENFTIRIKIASIAIRKNIIDPKEAILNLKNSASNKSERADAEMLDIFYKTYNGEDYQALLDNWDKEYKTQKIENFSFDLIENWIANINDETTRANLNTVLKFFNLRLAD